MRLIRFGAFLGWAAMASFAVAGFAAFAPGPAPAPTPEPTVTIQADSGPSVGGVAGRVAAMNYATSPSDAAVRPAPSLPDVAGLIETQAALNVTTTTAYVQPVTRSRSNPSAPAAPPARDYSNVPSSATSWTGLVEAYFAPADVNRALWVIHCESTGNPNATHPSSGAAGLFQHLPKFWEQRSANAGIPGADIYSPDANVAVAAWLVYNGGGWRHWNPSAHCWG